MALLLLSPRFTPDSIALREAALQRGWRVERLPNWRAPDWLRGQDLAVYGEPLFADVVADTLGLALLEPPLDWVTRLPMRYRRRRVYFSNLAEARRHDRPAFIKPADDKCFPAAVYASGSALPEAARGLPDATPVLLAEPVRWPIEMRCFVLDGVVQTLSAYSRDGDTAQAPDGTWPVSPDEEEAARAFVRRLLADPAVSAPPATVVDIGRIAGRGWAVVEANPAFGAGIYGCDPDRVLPVLARACRGGDAVPKADTRWVRQRPDV